MSYDRRRTSASQHHTKAPSGNPAMLSPFLNIRELCRCHCITRLVMVVGVDVNHVYKYDLETVVRTHFQKVG